jgi:hypothetical protein
VQTHGLQIAVSYPVALGLLLGPAVKLVAVALNRQKQRRLTVGHVVYEQKVNAIVADRNLKAEHWAALVDCHVDKLDTVAYERLDPKTVAPASTRPQRPQHQFLNLALAFRERVNWFMLRGQHGAVRVQAS